MKKAIVAALAISACLILSFLLGYGYGRRAPAPIRADYCLLPAENAPGR